MKPALACLLLLACTKSPASTAPLANTDAGGQSTTEAGAPRVSHRDELLREAAASGLAVVFQGWLEPEVVLGSAGEDACVRVRVASEADAGALESLQLREGEGDATVRSDLPLQDFWTAPRCVRKGTRLAVQSARTVEVVVVSSGPLL